LPHCEDHEARRKAKLNHSRSHARLSEDALLRRKLYASAAWLSGRKAFLRHNPLCVDCLDLGAVVEATEVDHVKRHMGDRVTFFDRSNWQALCKPCHSRKTAKEVFHGA
jgi:5-methylcytosine-specific restriction protein A